MSPTRLTAEQKLQALAYRFYQGAKWEPKPGDYYTSSRADLELYQVVDVRDGKVFTRYLVGSDVIAEWDASEFLAEHTFGRCRVFVPLWVLEASRAPVSQKEAVPVKELKEFRIAGQCNCSGCLRIRRDADAARSALHPSPTPVSAPVGKSEIIALLREVRTWIGDGENADDLGREIWTDAYADIIDRVDDVLARSPATEGKPGGGL